jgi:leader peptidase (prepilin peptidase)/N-methyltransferase
VRGLAAVLCGLAGLPVGWFVTLLIERVPDKQPLLAGARFGVPERGRDRLVVLATVALSAAMGARFYDSWALPGFLLFAAALLAVSVIDLDLFRIPNRIIYPTLLASVPLLALAGLLDADWASFRQALIGGAMGFGFLLVVHLINPRGMGFGDVKLAALLGLYLGWITLGHVPLGLFLGFAMGAIIGVGLMLTRRKSRRDPIPFGPFLAAGAIIAVLAGNPILDWYQGT